MLEDIEQMEELTGDNVESLWIQVLELRDRGREASEALAGWRNSEGVTIG